MAADMPASWPTPTTWPGGELVPPLDKALAVLAAHPAGGDQLGLAFCNEHPWVVDYNEHLKAAMKEALG